MTQYAVVNIFPRVIRGETNESDNALQPVLKISILSVFNSHREALDCKLQAICKKGAIGLFEVVEVE